MRTRFECEHILNGKVCLADFIEDGVRCSHCPYNKANFYKDKHGHEKPKPGVEFDI